MAGPAEPGRMGISNPGLRTKIPSGSVKISLVMWAPAQRAYAESQHSMSSQNASRLTRQAALLDPPPSWRRFVQHGPSRIEGHICFLQDFGGEDVSKARRCRLQARRLTPSGPRLVAPAALERPSPEASVKLRESCHVVRREPRTSTPSEPGELRSWPKVATIWPNSYRCSGRPGSAKVCEFWLRWAMVGPMLG